MKNKLEKRRCLLSMWLGIFFSGQLSLAGAQLVPPAQDYYLHFDQRTWKEGGEPLDTAGHQIAWVEETAAIRVTEALTIEAWVYWDGSGFKRLSSLLGIDLDRMTLMCGQRAYGFQYRYQWESNPGWTFFLETESRVHLDTGVIALPLGEWSHIAATYDGSQVRTYLNGQLQAETPVTGNIAAYSDSFDTVKQCSTAWSGVPDNPIQDAFTIGPGNGFKGGIRHLRVWNRALTQQEITDNAPLELAGDEPGLLSYWPMNGPPDSIEVANKVPGGPSLVFGYDHQDWGPQWHASPTWRSLDPVFEIREDLIEDIVAMDCPTFPEQKWNWAFIDLENDADLDLIFGGVAWEHCHGDRKLPLHAMIRDGENGYVYNNDAAFAGASPITHTSKTRVIGDFNGDGRIDLFSANGGNDFCFDDHGAVDTLLLSRPDGKLEDASDRLLAEPCTGTSPQFPEQHICLYGTGYDGRPAENRYPEPGNPVTPPKGATHWVAVGDTDGDGDLDILVGNINAERPYLLVGDGLGNFRADWQLLPDVLYAKNVEVTVDPTGYELADMDGDGHLDIITAPVAKNPFRADSEWSGGIFWSDGTGDFSASDSFVIRPTEGIPVEDTLQTPYSSGAMAVLDIENDGDKDLLVFWNPQNINDPYQRFRNSLQLLVNQGDRQFLDETVKRLGKPPQKGAPRTLVDQRVHALDFNGDGCTDVMIDRDVNRALDTIVWLNNCQGYFEPIPETLLTKRGGRYLPVDYDGDGDIDLIHANYYLIGPHTSDACEPGVGQGTDYVDFAVLLNVKGDQLKSRLILKDGFEK